MNHFTVTSERILTNQAGADVFFLGNMLTTHKVLIHSYMVSCDKPFLVKVVLGKTYESGGMPILPVQANKYDGEMSELEDDIIVSGNSLNLYGDGETYEIFHGPVDYPIERNVRGDMVLMFKDSLSFHVIAPSGGNCFITVRFCEEKLMNEEKESSFDDEEKPSPFFSAVFAMQKK